MTFSFEVKIDGFKREPTRSITLATSESNKSWLYATLTFEICLANSRLKSDQTYSQLFKGEL